MPILTPPKSPRPIDVGDEGDNEPANRGDCSLLDGLCAHAEHRHQTRLDEPDDIGLATGVVSMLAPFAA